MILLRDLKEDMRFDHSKDMPVYVSTCTTYDFNALTRYVEAIVLMCVFLCLITKMSYQFLEQYISSEFGVKLGKNASNTCAVLSEAY
jgi:hypothetical protein